MSHRLRVLLDARMLLGRFSGVGRVVTKLADHLTQRGDVRVIALCGDEPYAPWVHRNDIEMIATDFSRNDRTPLRRLWWEQTRLRHWIRRAGADVFHATWNSGIPRACPVPSVLTIHDLIPLRAHGAPTRLRDRLCGRAYLASVKRSAKRATAVTAVSQFTRNEVAEVLGLDPSGLTVIPNGVETGEFPARASCSQSPNHQITKSPNRAAIGPEPYLLYVGGFEPRKNIAGLLAAVLRYWEAGGSVRRLRLTGDPNRLDSEAVNALSRVVDRGRVVFMGNLTDLELSHQYQRAAALLFLSRDEGFGLPALEAMAHGCPVIAAATSSLPEVVGDAGILVEADEPDQVAACIERIVNSPYLRAGLVERGRWRAARLSWPLVVERWVGIYRRVSGVQETNSPRVGARRLRGPEWAGPHARPSTAG